MNFNHLSPVILEYLNSKGIDNQATIELAGTAGSNRFYYRIQNKSVTYILLQSPKEDKDFARFLRLTQFYRLLQFPVPRVYCIDDEALQVLLEDLGTHRLYDLVIHSQEKRKTYYLQTIQTLIDMQTKCFQQHQESPDILSRIFDQKQLLWETHYFKQEYLEGHCHLQFTEKENHQLESSFLELAKEVDLQPKTIMHRDFQSQNIMIQNERVRVIDYQGSRLGSHYYDLASLLFDPYCMLSEELIEELFQYYHSKTASPLSLDKARHQFYLAGSQRIMQAMGAYAFLSHKKNLASFKQYIKPGLQRLRFVLEKAELNAILSVLQ